MKNKRTWLGILFSVLFLILAFYQSDGTQIWLTIQAIKWSYILISIPLLFLHFGFKALRWRYLLLASGRPGLASLYGVTIIGNMASNILPLRLGEFVKIYLLGRREKISKSTIFATVIIERILDGLAILLLFLISVLILSQKFDARVMEWIRAFSFLALAGYIIVILFLVAVKIRTDMVIRIINCGLRFVPRIRRAAIEMVLSFVVGLAVLSNLGHLIISSLYSLMIWLVSAVFFLVVALSFQAEDHISLASQIGVLGTLFLLGIVTMGTMIPSSPGSVGTFEFTCILGLIILGVERSIAESYAIVLHASEFIPSTIAGIAYLAFQDYTFREITNGGATAKAIFNKKEK